MKKISILCYCIIALAAFAAWAPDVLAMSSFESPGAEGLSCSDCHPALANSGPGDANHVAHGEPTGQDCASCHVGSFNDPPIGVNCTRCHGRAQDAGGDTISLGEGRGLRQHHQNAGASNCGQCHGDATGPPGVGEDVLPAFYPGVGAVPLDPCDGSEENFPSNTVSLDNDGDLLTDGADPDCVPVDPCAGVNCDDGVACTDDSCVDGNCINTPVDANCEDGNFCTGTESCDAVSGCSSSGNPCAAGETCNEVTDTCDPAPDCTVDADCDNGMFCDGAETCVGGQCLSGTAVDCNDGVGCTDDACNEATDACDNTPNDSRCDDGQFCNGAETCDANNDCMAGSNPCAPGETCDEATDTCEAPPTGCTTDADCDDGMFCNGAEKCNVATGECMPGMTPCQAGETCDEAGNMCIPPGEKTGCLFNPNESTHTDCEDGCLHAPGKEKPFRNGCTGCHGANLMGGIAPSCFTCHGPEWDEKPMGVSGCAFNPPGNHTDSEDGCLHAPGKEKPFRNGCASCHGADLLGDIGPSCFTCHGPEWDEKPMGVSGCAFNPPGNHTDSEDGCLHAPGKEKPFSNGCADCHGADLLGDFGPSCYTCHGMEWEEKNLGMGCPDHDDRDDDESDRDDDESDDDDDDDRRRYKWRKR